MAYAYDVRIKRNMRSNGQDLHDDMVVHMQSNNDPRGTQAGRDEIARRFQQQYGVDIKKANLGWSNLDVERH